MHIAAVTLRNLRIIEAAELLPAVGINVLTGANGSGKTSLLEGLYLLGRGRSFRSRRARDVVREGGEALEVRARLVDAGGRERRIGLRKGGGRTEIALDGRRIDSSARLAAQVPVALIDPRSSRLLEGGPAVRRRLLDWLLFHVEQGYLEQWRRYARAVRQRNVMLRRQAPVRELETWERELWQAGDVLHAMRERGSAALVTAFSELGQGLVPEGVMLAYRPGWDTEAGPLAAGLRAGRDRDRQAGYTRLGPHRADLAVGVEGRAAVDFLSRGQAKLVVSVLVAAYARVVAARTGERPVLLMDDFRAELDAEAAGRLGRLVRRMGGQSFLTVTDRELLGDFAGAADRVFHVERGAVRMVV